MTDSKMTSKQRRHQKTVEFMLKHVPLSKSILDLGTSNRLTSLLQDQGYVVFNTIFDLDKVPGLLSEYSTDVVAGFEILEHLVEPAPALKAITSRYIVMSVPLPRRFDKLYWNPDDERDQHYHEFHVCQFNKLLRHCGWRIIATELWKSHSSFLGYLVYPQSKYYIVYAEKWMTPDEGALLSG